MYLVRIYIVYCTNKEVIHKNVRILHCEYSVSVLRNLGRVFVQTRRKIRLEEILSVTILNARRAINLIKRNNFTVIVVNKLLVPATIHYSKLHDFCEL